MCDFVLVELNITLDKWRRFVDEGGSECSVVFPSGTPGLPNNN